MSDFGFIREEESRGPSGHLLSRLANWAYLRQRLSHAEPKLIDALRQVIAVYSSHPTAPLALLSRSKPFDTSAFMNLKKQRRAVRIPAMRQSIFLVPLATAGRMLAATRLSTEKHVRRIRNAGMDLKKYNRLKARVLELTQKPTGDGLPLMLRGRRAVATWSHKFDREQMLVEVTPLGRTAVPPRLYEPAFESIAQLLGASEMKLASAKAFGKSA